MEEYLEIVDNILTYGKLKADRTGVGTLAVFGVQFRHDMSKGFPLLTSKKMAHKAIRVELEGFLKGVTDKHWYQERDCIIWNDWCNPAKVPYSHDDETKKRMKEERDLGPIYGKQWRDFNGEGYDQLEDVVNTLKRDPNSRRMVVSAWNPVQREEMALEPCHYSFQVDVIDNKLNLAWNQRSVDTMLGLPFNIASYGILLHLLAKESGYEEGVLVGNLGDTHIYKNHIEGARMQLERAPLNLPKIKTKNFYGLFNWDHTNTSFKDYESHSPIGRDVFPINV